MNGKNVLVLYGSPRANSQSKLLCQRLLKSAGESCNIKTYNTYEMNISPCRACGYCSTHIGCALGDLDGFAADFENADYVVIATPIYNMGVPAPLKALVDRGQCCYALRFDHGVKPTIEKPKRAAIVVTAGCNGDGFDTVEAMFKQQFTVLNTELVTSVFVNHTDTKPVDEAAYSLAEKAGKELFE